MDFSDETKAVLSKGGWTADRRVDITPYINCLKEEGYVVNTFAQDFLLNFGGLELEQPRYRLLDSDPPGEMHFNPLKACAVIYRERVEDYEEVIGESLAVVGEAFNRYITLMISETGKVYGGYDHLLVLIGNDCTQAIDSIVLGKQPYRIR